MADERGTLGRILSWPSMYAFLIAVMIGGLLCGVSFGLHIDDVKTSPGSPYSCQLGDKCVASELSCVKGDSCASRQVGYLWAPNWSLTYAFLGPFALFLMLAGLKETRGALDYLYESGMVRDEFWVPIKENRSGRLGIEGPRSRNVLMVVCAGVVPAAFAYPEWYWNNLIRLRSGFCLNCELSDYDWGLAAIMPGPGQRVGWLENSLFDFLAFSCEALLIGATIASFLYLMDLSQVLPGPESRLRLRLFPNLRSNDPRRGFQKFEDPLQLMLSASLTFYLICYLIRINRIYMRTPGFTSAIDFVQRDISNLVTSKVLEHKGSELLGVLLGSPSEPKFQEFFGGVALILVSFFSLAVIARTVGSAASHAKANAVEYYERQDCQSLFGLSIEEERKRASEMTTWPLEWRYLQLHALLVIVFMAVVMLWYYRVGLYIFLVVVAALLAKALKQASK